MGLKMTKVTKNPNIVVGHFFVKVLHYKEKFSFSCYKASTRISEELCKAGNLDTEWEEQQR